MPDKPVLMGGEPITKLEDVTVARLWNDYSASQLPTVTVTGEFVREQLRTAYLCGAWTMLALEERLRKETPERRTALLDRLRAEHESAIQALSEGGLNG